MYIHVLHPVWLTSVCSIDKWTNGTRQSTPVVCSHTISRQSTNTVTPEEQNKTCTSPIRCFDSNACDTNVTFTTRQHQIETAPRHTTIDRIDSGRIATVLVGPLVADVLGEIVKSGRCPATASETGSTCAFAACRSLEACVSSTVSSALTPYCHPSSS